MINLFDNTECVNTVIKLHNIKPNEIKEAVNSNNVGEILCIPIMIDMEPTPYSSVRVDPRSMRMYVPNKEKLVKQIRELIIDYTGIQPFIDGRFPVFVETIVKIDFYLPTPKSYSKIDTLKAELKKIRPIVTPDYDNVVKIINDGIKSFVIYDDAQIIEANVGKYYSIKPRIEVGVYFHNGTPFKVHEKLIHKRIESWKKCIASGKLVKIIALLQKYIHT